MNGNVVLSEVECVHHLNDEAINVPIARASASLSQENYSVAAARDGQVGPNNGWALLDASRRPVIGPRNLDLAVLYLVDHSKSASV